MAKKTQFPGGAMTRHGKQEINADFRAECDLDGFIGSLMTPHYRAQIDRLADSYVRLHPVAYGGQTGRANPQDSAPDLGWVKADPAALPAIFMDGWRRQYPDWEYRLWTDSDVKGLKLECESIISQSACMGQKSDLLRVEILKQFGGLYVDCDYESLRPLDDIHERYDF